MTTNKPKLSHEDFTKKRQGLLEELNNAIAKRDLKTQRQLRKLLQSEDLVP